MPKGVATSPATPSNLEGINVFYFNPRNILSVMRCRLSTVKQTPNAVDPLGVL